MTTHEDKTIIHAHEQATEALDEAQRIILKANETAEVDAEKTDRKINRLGWVADQWMKLASVVSETAEDVD